MVFIALVGECLEALTFERAQRAIGKLLDFYPRTARVIRERDRGRGSDRSGRRRRSRGGPARRADHGRRGRCARAVRRRSGRAHRREHAGLIRARATPFIPARSTSSAGWRSGPTSWDNETTLGQVIRLLADAQRHRSPLERTADRYARLFLPAVLSIAAIVFLGTNGPAIWRWMMTGPTLAIDLLPTLAVLVVACPCALVLATPAAVLAATARLAQRGVLVKGGAAIEGLARVNTIAFDKTGTLTEGKPELGDCIPLGSNSADINERQNELLRLAAAAEQPSEHPLARLLVAEANRRGLALPGD